MRVTRLLPNCCLKLSVVQLNTWKKRQHAERQATHDWHVTLNKFNPRGKSESRIICSLHRLITHRKQTFRFYVGTYQLNGFGDFFLRWFRNWGEYPNIIKMSPRSSRSVQNKLEKWELECTSYLIHLPLCLGGRSDPTETHT